MSDSDGNVVLVIQQIEDFLVPHLELDTFEKSLYYHLFRHTRLIGKTEFLFVISAAPKAVGMTDYAARDRIRALDKKGCIKIREITRNGLIVEVYLPAELPGCIKDNTHSSEPIDIENIDFYNDPVFRKSIFEREKHSCFYCYKKITDKNGVLDHLIAQVNKGTHSYRNVVACCHECNSKKRGQNGVDFVRGLYRNGIVNSEELQDRLTNIEKLINGEIKPQL